MKNTIHKSQLIKSAKLVRGIFFILLAFILASCSMGGSKWNNSWPTFSTPPQANAKIALVETSDVFTLMRAKWYSNKFEVSEEQSYEYFGKISDSIVKVTLKKFYPELSTLPSSTRKQLSEETIRFDKKIFLKGKFPEQGKAIEDNGTTPSYLLLIHEITLGTDLNKQDFFDFDLKQNEMDLHKTVQNMTVILTFTLWDNLKQVPLYSAILEENMPVTKAPQLKDVEQLLTMVVSKIPFEIAKGAR